LLSWRFTASDWEICLSEGKAGLAGSASPHRICRRVSRKSFKFRQIARVPVRPLTFPKELA
jgi:hypothetical protein